LVKLGYVVAFDRSFTIISLFEELDKRGINGVGTIFKTRVGQPIMTVNESNLPQGEFVAKFGAEAERVFLYGKTLSRFDTLSTSMAQRSSRCKGSSVMVRSEQSRGERGCLGQGLGGTEGFYVSS
jgi:hypothetical protein